MSYTDLSGKFATCIKLVSASTTLYWSSTSIHEATADWEPRILSINLQRGYSLESSDIQQQNITIEVDNTDSEIIDQIAAGTVGGATAYIYLTQVNDDGSITHNLRAIGTVSLSDVRIIDEVRIQLQIEPTIKSYFQKNLQYTITNDVFANAADDAIGQGWPIVLNYCTVTHGLIKLPCIDTTTNAEKFMFAQGTITAFGNLYQLSGGVWTTLTLTTHYTVTTGATDAKGRTYNYVTLASGVYTDGDQYFANVQGMKVSGSLETNPATMLYTLITDSDYGWQVPTALVNAASFTAFETKCSDRGYVGSGVWGGVIPWEAGAVVDSQTLLRTICANLGAALAVNADGELVLVDGDYTQLPSSNDYEFTDLEGDYQKSEISYPFDPIASATVRYGKSHQDSPYANYFLAENSTVESAFTNAGDESIDYPLVHDSDAAIALAKQHMLIRSGKVSNIQADISGYHGLQADVGDIIGVTLPVLRHDGKPFQVYSIDDNLLSAIPHIEAVSMSDQYGSIAISLEETATLAVDTATFIGATEFDCSGTDYTDANANSNYGSETYLRHGHHYPDSTVCVTLDKGYYNVNWRTFMRFVLPSATWSSRTITAVSVQIQITSVPSLEYNVAYHIDGSLNIIIDNINYRSTWNGSTIHKCNSSAWGLTSSYNNFDGDAYNAGTDQGASLGSFGNGTGTKTVALNATGLAMFVAAAAGTGQGAGGDEVNLCLENLSDGNYTDAAVISKTIKALITYTT